MRRDGSHKHTLGRYLPGREPSWSPDGRHIVIGCSDWDICEMRADGTHRQRLATSDAVLGDPCYSPDGRFILFFHDFRIWQMSADGSDQHPMDGTAGDDPNTDGMTPAWQPK